jgi:hypothetical protein
MSRQTFREPMADPPVANQTTVTGGTAITALWDAANLTALPGNTVKAGQAYKVTAWGIVTTAVTGSQTATFTPFFGTTTGAGTSLGASIAAPLEAKVFGTGSATATTVNTTAASGLLLAVTPSLATQSWTCLGVVAEALN